MRSPEALTAPPLTVGLPFSIAGVRPERPAAGPAFVRVFHARPIRLPEGAWGLQARKKNQKEEGRRAFRKRAGRKSSRRRRNFKPPDLPHFHSAADNPWAWWNINEHVVLGQVFCPGLCGKVYDSPRKFLYSSANFFLGYWMAFK